MIVYDSFDVIDYTKFIREFVKKYKLRSRKGLPKFFECGDCLLTMDNEPTVITRKEWEARSAKNKIRQQSRVKRLVVTWTKTDDCSNQDECTKIVKKLQNEQMDDELCDDIRYNFIIGGDGNIYEGRGWKIRPEIDIKNRSKAENLEENCVYMAFIGPEDGLPTSEMVKAISSISTVGVSREYIDKQVTLMKREGETFEERTHDLEETDLRDEEEAELMRD